MSERHEPLYRQQWYTLLQQWVGPGVTNLTPDMVHNLWTRTRDEFLLQPVAKRPLISAEDEEPRPIGLPDLFTEPGIQFLIDVGNAEIGRVDDCFLPRIKIRRKRDKDLLRELNLTYAHREKGRQRLGHFTPFEAGRDVTPTLMTQSLQTLTRANKITQIIARCDKPDIAIVTQLNAAPPEPDEDPDGPPLDL